MPAGMTEFLCSRQSIVCLRAIMTTQVQGIGYPVNMLIY
ncbi:hypothetical protein EC970259_4961 [Escherichia coli 99.0741]|nr:hypothetical protein EC970259_4961 [Escherichia coli 99.0741]